MTLRRYDIFISHVWEYGEQYLRLVEMLDDVPRFSWRDLSVPEGHPIHSKSERVVAAEINRRIRRAHVVLALSGVYATRSDWMPREIAMATDQGRPILGLRPHGQANVSSVVKRAEVMPVRWSTKSIVKAIKKHAVPVRRT